jgi:hypothetical protein
MVLVLAIPVATLLTRGHLSGPARAAGYEWSGLPTIAMRGDLKAFWNVFDSTTENTRQAYAHGFLPISIVDPYSNRAGGSKERIDTYAAKNNKNPWAKPPFFERVIRADTARVLDLGTYVQDIEFSFENDTRKAWVDKDVRVASGAANFADFDDAYFREWASWFWLPLKWTKDTYPDTHVGLYGRQPFDCDYWGVANKTTAEIEAKHQLDWRLWKSIDPYVDVYIVDIYNFYETPGSVFYMAANVEMNFQRARELGKKPIYAYEWMRYHDTNLLLHNRELPPFLVEAMASVPYFSGASGIVLWGAEPQLKPGDGQPYKQLPLYMKTLERIAGLSDKISRGKLIIEEPANVLWKEHRPLVRRIEIGETECVTLAVNPWQNESDISGVDISCGGKSFRLQMQGRHVTLAHILGDVVSLH